MANTPNIERIVRQVRALLEKTVANAATPGEQDAAVAKARELCDAHGLDQADFEWPPLAVEAGGAGGRTVRAICEQGILAGLTTAQIIANVKAELGEGRQTSPGCVAWYKSKMRKRGALAPVARSAAASTQ